MQLCPSCGEENPAKFRLCGYCGSPLSAAPAPAPVEETRRTVSIVFSDLQGSTDLGERLDSEALREVLGVYFDRMCAVLERHGGTVEKYIGDAIMAVFGLPTVHEDDALRAVRAAYEMCEALHRLNDELERGWGVRLTNRTGVNTGEVVAGDAATAQRLVTGDPVNVAARLEQAAPPVEVLIGDTTYRLVAPFVEVEPLEPLTLKGKSEPVPAYRLLAVNPTDTAATRPRLPMLGRDREMRLLGAAYDDAVAGAGTHLVTVVASAGTGKSRLLAEFVGTVSARARTFTGRCPSYGEGITFWPIAEMVRDAAGIEASDTRSEAAQKLATLVPDAAMAVALAAVTGLGDADVQVEQIFAAVAAMFARLATSRPVIVVIEDVHWAQSTLLDLIDHLVSTSTGDAVLVVCTTRPEFFEANADWLVERERVQRLLLAPLPTSDGDALVRSMLGDGPLLDDVTTLIVSAAGGNPLFLEQMVAMLIDDGRLARDADGGWRPTRRLDSVAVPSTVSALLGARLERLAPAERSVLQRASVMGQVFYRDAVVATAPEALRDHVAASVDALVSKGLIAPESSYLAGQDAYRFHHALIRDVAYHQLLKRTRAELHESFASWLDAAAGTRAQEYEEIVGYHLEQSFRARCELGPPDERVRGVGREAGERLARSGSRALARADMPAAANLLGRALDLLDRESPRRRALLADHVEALYHLGDYAAVEAALDDADALAAETADVQLQAQVTIERLWTRWQTHSGESFIELLQPAHAAIEVLGREEDHRRLARAWRLVGLVHMSVCRYAAAAQALERALDHARASGDRRTLVRVLSTYVQNVTEGPTTVPDAIAACLDLQDRVPEDRWTQALVADQLSRLYAMRGDFRLARSSYRQCQDLLDALGAKVIRAMAADSAGEVELLAGEPAAALAQLQRGYDVLRALDSRNYLSTVAARLADALVALGRLEEAERLTEVSAESAADDDVMSQVLWRAARARSRQATAAADALSLAEEAVALAREVESPALLGTALLAYAEALLAAAAVHAARAVAREAREVFAAKGFTVGVDRAARLMAAPTVIDLTAAEKRVSP